jgi:hypothetical protein
MPDENGVQSHFVPAEVRNNSRLAMKFVDTGTSMFWDKHDKFEHREREVVIETANRLLKDDLSVDTAIDLSQIQSHSRILESIDHLCTFQAALVLAKAELAEHHRIDFDDDWFGDAHHHTQAWLPHFRRAVEAVSDAPIFNLDWVLATLKSGPFSIKKFFRAIASSVNFDDECLWDDPFKEGVVKKINRRYAANRSAYIAGQYKRSAIVC